jgi:hypothetical protein
MLAQTNSNATIMKNSLCRDERWERLDSRDRVEDAIVIGWFCDWSITASSWGADVQMLMQKDRKTKDGGG